MSFLELYEALKAYNDELNRGELALQAYIQNNPGLDIMVQQLAQDLGLSEEALANNSKGIMQLAASINEANKKTKAFHKVLTDQIEAFSSGEKRSEEYRKALSLITESAKEVFGEHIDSSFVEKYHNLFEQLA
jgi:phage-related tail protein